MVRWSEYQRSYKYIISDGGKKSWVIVILRTIECGEMNLRVFLCEIESGLLGERFRRAVDIHAWYIRVYSCFVGSIIPVRIKFN